MRPLWSDPDAYTHAHIPAPSCAHDFPDPQLASELAGLSGKHSLPSVPAKETVETLLIRTLAD